MQFEPYNNNNNYNNTNNNNNDYDDDDDDDNNNSNNNNNYNNNNNNNHNIHNNHNTMRKRYSTKIPCARYVKLIIVLHARSSVCNIITELSLECDFKILSQSDKQKSWLSRITSLSTKKRGKIIM